jgi:hypothetical protein
MQPIDLVTESNHFTTSFINKYFLMTDSIITEVNIERKGTDHRLVTDASRERESKKYGITIFA